MKKKKIFITSLIVFSVLLGLDNFSSVRSETDNRTQKAIDYIKAQPQNPWSTMAMSAAGKAGRILSPGEIAQMTRAIRLAMEGQEALSQSTAEKP